MKTIIASGGGIRAAAFTIGAMQRIGVDQPMEFIGKSGSTWAIEAISKLGNANEAEAWLLKNFSRTRDVYRRDWWGIIKNRNLYHYGPLLKTLEALTRGYRIQAKYVVFDTDDMTDKLLKAHPAAAVHSSSIKGAFYSEINLYDVGSRGMGESVMNYVESLPDKSECILLNAYNDQQPTEDGILGGLLGEVEAGIAEHNQTFAHMFPEMKHIEYPLEPDYQIGIQDFDSRSIQKAIAAGRVAAMKAGF